MQKSRDKVRLVSTANIIKKKLSMAVVFVEYDRSKYGGSDNVFYTLQKYLANIQGCRLTYLRVNNKQERWELKKDGNIYTIGGNNTYREFSGWQKGVEIIQGMNNHFDLILFVNDMLLKPGESFLKDYADISLLKKSLNENNIIGRIDSTGQHYTAYGYDVSQWVCTNCFLAPMAAVQRLKNMVSVKDTLADFLPDAYPGSQVIPTSFFKENAPINETYKAWLIEWLTERWHSKFQIEEKTWNLFRIKVRNILNESLLTARFAEIGYEAERYGDKFYY